MRVEHFDSIERLAPWADDWDRMAAGVPFRTWTWATTWWRHYGASVANRRMAVLGVFDARHALVGLAPWYLESEGTSHRVIRFLGSGEVCSDYLSLLAEPGLEKPVASALAHHLLREAEAARAGKDGLGRWSLIELTGVDSRDAMVDWLAGHLALGGSTVHRRMGPPCRRTELPGSLEAYVDSLSKNSRRKVRRLQKAFLHSGRAELRTVTGLGQLNEAMDRLVDLHQRRQQMLGRPGCFASGLFTGFHRDVAARMLTAGQLQLHTLWIDGEPAAVEYDLAGDGVVFGYQSGIDPRRLKLQPGHVLQLAVLGWAIANGYRAYDFLRGDEPYKSHWNARRRDSLEIRIVGRHGAAQLRHAVWLAGVEAKHWVRQGLGRFRQH